LPRFSLGGTRGTWGPYRLAKWKREAEEWYAHDSVVFERLFKDVHKRVVRVLCVLRQGVPSHAFSFFENRPGAMSGPVSPQCSSRKQTDTDYPYARNRG
jgi:hypothetical protein